MMIVQIIAGIVACEETLRSMRETHPEQVDDALGKAEAAMQAIAGDNKTWNTANGRRCELIRKKFEQGPLPLDEAVELALLQRLLTSRRQLVAPLRLKELDEFARKLGIDVGKSN